MKRKIIIIIMAILVFGYISYILMLQNREIARLEEQLQHTQLKLKLIHRDPYVKKAIDAGG